MPNLSPNLVIVTETLASDGTSKIYSIQFSADLGDVSLLHEITKGVTCTISEQTKGVPSGARVKLVVQNQTTGLFKLSDTAINVTQFNSSI